MMPIDNYIDLERVHSINSVTNGRRSNGFLESNREESGTNPWLALSRIMGPLGISDEMDKTTTRSKIILLLSRNVLHKARGKWKMR